MRLCYPGLLGSPVQVWRRRAPLRFPSLLSLQEKAFTQPFPIFGTPSSCQLHMPESRSWPTVRRPGKSRRTAAWVRQLVSLAHAWQLQCHHDCFLRAVVSAKVLLDSRWVPVRTCGMCVCTCSLSLSLSLPLSPCACFSLLKLNSGSLFRGAASGLLFTSLDFRHAVACGVGLHPGDSHGRN